jgi:hypothetical protein
LYFTVTETPNRPIFETAKNIIVNLAVGGDFGGDPNGTTIWPQTMYVDYVRYWNRQDPLKLTGDYNGDGVVNLADYTLWRDSLGATGLGLAADGSGNGVVGISDYQLWAENFGNMSASVASHQVPEPNALLLLCCTTVGWIFNVRR